MRKVFNKRRIAVLKKMKLKGRSHSEIARHFQCDRSSVVYQLQKLGLSKGITFAKNRRKGHIELSTAVRLRKSRSLAKV